MFVVGRCRWLCSVACVRRRIGEQSWQVFLEIFSFLVVSNVDMVSAPKRLHTVVYEIVGIIASKVKVGIPFPSF